MLLALSPPLAAEMGGDDYRSEVVIDDVAERGRVRALIEAARAREAEAAAQRHRDELERARLTAEAEAARPLGERLLRQRCTQCHTLETVLQPTHTYLGWQFVVARMRYWNGAQVADDEVLPIVGYLTDQRLARGGRRLLEYGLMAGLVALCLFGVSRTWKSTRG